MDIMKCFEIQLQIIINKRLYEKGVIDEETYLSANDRLIKKVGVIDG